MFPFNALVKYYFGIMKEANPVILKLEGGLGNQLFQLAAGYYLASKLKTDLQLDQYSIPLTTVHGETRNGFEELFINPLPNSKSILLLDGLPGSRVISLAKRSNFIKKLILKIRIIRSNKPRLELFLESNELETTQELLDLDVPHKLHGNFQSWEIVQKASVYGFPKNLRLRVAPEWIKELEKKIAFKNSIVLHFRVGDDTRANYNFKQPDISYYLTALATLRARTDFSSIYVLSDDINRVKEMFGERLPSEFQYLEMPDESSPAERLYVLSLFGGIVCANSTFCGWAAWSISNSGGDVVVPVPYSDSLVLGTRDFPPNWIKLDKYSGAEVS
jgi:hypothetical protein